MDNAHAFQDYYVEYLMLFKLQALTNNFTCQNCWQVLTFAKFFDEDHTECLKKVVVPNALEGATPVSQVGNDSFNEIKETRAMLGPIDASDRPPKYNNLKDEVFAAGVSAISMKQRQSSY